MFTTFVRNVTFFFYSHFGFFSDLNKKYSETPKWLTSREVFAHVALDTSKHNELLIVPTTFKEGEDSVFKLSVYCDDEISLKPEVDEESDDPSTSEEE